MLIRCCQPLAVVASEDQRFLSHNGFDFNAISKARSQHYQSANSKECVPVARWGMVQKGAGAYFTMLIELMWDKHRIMEVYLNVIETGDGIYGVDAQSASFQFQGSVTLYAQEADRHPAADEKPGRNENEGR